MLQEWTFKEYGTVLFTVADKDKEEALNIAKRFHEYRLSNYWQQKELQNALEEAGIPVKVVDKIGSEGPTYLMSFERGSSVCDQYINKRKTART